MGHSKCLEGHNLLLFVVANNQNFVDQICKWIQAALMSPWGICKSSSSCCLVLWVLRKPPTSQFYLKI